MLEWADSIRQDYSKVEKCGGAGDMGRDIIAFCTEDGGDWDNYQCKHYDHPLRPSDIWVEFGKLIYYTNLGYYSCPRRYYFVAPQGAGTKLSNLLRKPEDLRLGLIENWNNSCRSGITSTTPIDLDDGLLVHLNSFDFSIFEAIPPLRLIEQHAKTRYYVARFGGGLPARPPVLTPPPDPTPLEANYIRQLLQAYADYLKRPVSAVEDIGSNPDLQEHFSESRLEFYSAESLRTFSRDTLPSGEFEELQDEVLSGVGDEVRAEHPDGYRRIVAVVRAARFLQITASALVTRLVVRDRGGICHQLANDFKIRWVR